MSVAAWFDSSTMLATKGCAIDLVLIATEGDKAIDVFHITQNGRKLNAADQRALSAQLQQILEDDE